MTTLLIATRNAHKVAEIRAILGAQFQFLTLDDFPKAPKVIEDAETFAGNATKKARSLINWLGPSLHFQSCLPRDFFTLADDSGLEVDALDGAPGVRSARFAALETALATSPHSEKIRDMVDEFGENLVFRAAENTPDADNNAKLLRSLKDVPPEKRTARFRCVIALVTILEKKIENASPVCYADELELQTQLFDGICEGQIIFEPRGQNGFGYDPLFVPDGFEQSFAELGEDVKNKLSHRAKALAKLKIFLNGNPG